MAIGWEDLNGLAEDAKRTLIEAMASWRCRIDADYSKFDRLAGKEAFIKFSGATDPFLHITTLK